jgi:cellulose synthase/poly-beta-1,6-N-acetylglucosamine synthase-like glycosyltransferase
MIYLFWISVFILFYHLIGYGVLLKFLNILKRRKFNNTELSDFPTITVLCPAFNEEDVIDEKIRSFLTLDYPKDKIEMIVISDDSTDRTNEIVNNYTAEKNVKLVIQKPRRGKQSGHNLVEPSITSEYILSTDANSIFKSDSVKLLLQTMKKDPQIKIVSGELKLLKGEGEDSGEGLYWKYESWLKRMESDFHSIIGSNGSIYLIKREYFKQVDPASVDDFERTLLVLKAGKKAKYEPKAVVTEDVTEKPIEEIGRKIRMITQQWQCLERNTFVFNIFRNFRVFFMFVSHKLIRWMLPAFSLAIIISSISLRSIMFYKLCLLTQLLIYCFGYLEISLEKKGKSINKLKLPAYFTAMNYSALIAFFKYLKSEKFSTWKIQR